MKAVEALIAVVALVTMAPPTIAENANIKYALECGAAKSTPPDNDYSDPIYKTKIAVTDEVIYVVHYAASGETFIRNEQYRDLRFWGQEKTDNWSGVSIKRLDWTMVGTIRIEKGRQWVEYIEKLFSGGKLQYRQPSSAYVDRSQDQKVPRPLFSGFGVTAGVPPTWLACSTHVYVDMNFLGEPAGEENE